MASSPWPSRADFGPAGLSIGGMSAASLAEEFGTPLWVVDEADLRDRCRAYLAAFPGVDVAYASKAWCTTAILQIVVSEGLAVDVVSGGELRTAVAAGVAMDRIVFHGNNKSVAELEMAVGLEVGRIVVDSEVELGRLDAIARASGRVVDVWLRITPGIDAHTHEYVRTGHDDSKFGFTLSLGLADRAIAMAMAFDHLRVVGVHAHVGSQIFGTDAFVANAEVMISLLARWRAEHRVILAELNLGGGMGIHYTHEDHPVTPQRYGDAMVSAVGSAAKRHGFPPPSLSIEPGRAIVGPSTVTLYSVGTVKALPGLTTWVSVDGGMSDNIRPALYDAEHEVALAGRRSSAEPQPVAVVGKHCESGDLIRRRTTLPGDVAPGDLLAVAATGAYTESMASNYNRLPRPAAVLIRDGTTRLIIRRETIEDVLARDIALDAPADGRA